LGPYWLAGLTWNGGSLADDYDTGTNGTYEGAEASDTLFGPQAGLGLEFALGDRAALNVEGRTIRYIDRSDEDLSAPSALQGTVGLNFYF